MFSTDKPIENSQEDKLGRIEFVKRVSKAIYEFNSTDNFAIALQGKWGCGKTSILNMISNEIDTNSNTTIVVKFNPWNFTDCNQLISQFFKNLSTELKKQSDNKVVKNDKKIEIGTEIGRVVDKYSYALEYAKYIPVFGKYLEIIPQLVSSIGSTIADESDSKSNDIIYQKNELIKILKSSKSRIVIIIDDIDRLPDEQIKLIFQLVSSVANFPNITYLLSYDKKIVVKALNNVQGENGEEYLEKIIQLSFDVPDVKSSKIYDLLIDKIKENIELPEGELNSLYCHNVLYKCVLPFISSARNVNRYLNTLSFSYPPVKDEVCFADMAAICAFQLFAHHIYEWIKNNKYSLVGGYNGGGISQNDIAEIKNNVTKSLETIYSGNIDVIISALSVAFPSFNNKVSHNSVFITTLDLRKEKRIASAERFDVYFSLDLEDVRISDAEFKMSINEMNEFQLREYLSLLKHQDLLSDYKNELRLYSKEIDEDRIELLLSVLMFSSGRIKSTNQLTEYNDKLVDVYFLIELLKIINDENHRYSIIKSIIDQSDFLSFQKLLHLPHIIELNYGKIASTEYQYEEKIISEEHLKDLENIIVNRIEYFSKIENIFYWQECHRALLLWEVINKESYTNFISEQIKSKINAIILTSLAIGEWSNSDGVGEYELHPMPYCNYLDFFDDETILNYIGTMRNNEEFWKLENRTINRIIAFYIIKQEKETALINAKTVDDKYKEWHYSFANQK